MRGEVGGWSAAIIREREVEAVVEQLCSHDARLLTLTGPGGVGKTRLSIAIAARVQAAFPDGVVFVSLAPLSPDALVIPTIAALGIGEKPGMTLIDHLAREIDARRLLLVIDNVEHVLNAIPLLADFLARCPNLSMLATSRLPLHLYGEREYPVPPISLPLATPHVSPDDVANSPAAMLFVERVRSASRASL